MRAQIKLGSISGIKIGLHYSWVIIALLIMLSLASHFHMINPDWGQGLVVSIAILTALLFFTAIVLHELSHAAVAKSRGLPVRSITLFALGGVAEIEQEAADAKTEFWMGIVGPLTSLAIGLICLGVVFAFGWEPSFLSRHPLLTMLLWLGYINILLALFNMVPGYPLDGGRVLRAIVWWITGDAKRATRIAATAGQFVAFLMIMVGIVRFFTGAGIGGLWIAFIGWFLLDASRASYAQVTIGEALAQVRVVDVMSTDSPKVDGLVNLQTFVHEFLLRTGRPCFVVTVNGRVEGFITASDAGKVNHARWPYTTVDDVMQRLDSVPAVRPETSVAAALEIMAREDVSQLPVVSDGKLAGLISRDNILQLIQTRAQLDV